MLQLSQVITTLAATFVVAGSATDVFAHFMVQNSWAYNLEQWREDMLSAKSVGIDAFAMNWMPPDCQDDLRWQEFRIDDAYEVAEEVVFKIIHSFDMSWTPCHIYWNTSYMAGVLKKHATSTATYRWNNSILVTTYGGDSVKQYGNIFFQDLKAKMEDSNNAISLTPALTQYSTSAQRTASESAAEMIRDFPAADGYFNWQAWPVDDNVNNTCAADKAFHSALQNAGKSGPYIMAVSPWQFKDLDNGNQMDAWVAPSDWLFVKRLEAVALGDIKPDIIELLTWNDWCESHYLRDLPGNSTSASDHADMGTMGAYVAGQNHSPWRIIASYYISWWKKGKKPEITKDQVVFWYRVHAKNAQCSQGSDKIRNSDLLEDAVFAWAAVPGNSSISMSFGEKGCRDFQADASGPVLGSLPFPADLGDGGMKPTIAVSRGNQTMYKGTGPKFVTSWWSTKNFNPVVSFVGQGNDDRGHA